MRLPLPLALSACRADEPDPDPAGCGVGAAVGIERFTAAAGPIPTQVVLEVELGAPAAVAARCVSDDDPEEVFLVEDAALTGAHTLRLSGLVPHTTYTCAAAATCPKAAGGPALTRYAVGPAPAPPITIRVDPRFEMRGAWTLAPWAAGAVGDTWIVVWGPDGTPRWWTPLPEGVGRWIEARYHPEEGVIVWGGGMDPEGRVRVLDPWDGERFAFEPRGWHDVLFHHDGKRVADGRLMTLEVRPNRRGGDTWAGFGLRLVDPRTGAVDLDWDSQAAVDAGFLPPPASPDDEDPWHANWVDLSADGSTILVSLCFAEALVALDARTGEPRWALGPGRGWTVEDADGAPLTDEDLPQCQHGAEVLGDRELLLYDNGGRRGRSSAAIWSVDPATRTARRQWTWSEPGWWQPYYGDVDDLGGGRVLITVASDWAEAELLEVDRPTGLVASRTTLPDSGYRAERYDGCALFDAVRACPALAERHAALRPLFEPPG